MCVCMCVTIVPCALMNRDVLQCLHPTWYWEWVPRLTAGAAPCSTWNPQFPRMSTTLKKVLSCSTMNNAHGGRKEKRTLRCLYNEGNVFVQFVLLGESPSYFLYLKGAEDARFDFSATENDAEMILRLIWEWVMNNQLLSYSCWGPSSLWWMTLSIPVVPFRSIDLSLRHVSTTWPGHYGCDPDARGQYQRSCYPSQGAAGSEAKLSQKRDT